MKDTKVRKMVVSALLAALVCVSTMAISIPSPTGGYVNPGDCFVLLAGWLLGPYYGGMAAGIGSFLTDLTLGYTYYAPASFLIKGLDALLAAKLYRLMGKGRSALIVSGLLGELWMAAGYFGFTALLMGKGWSALLSVPGNLVQGAVGMILGVLLMHVAQKRHIAEKLSY